MIGSPQMALLTPQMKENQMVQEIPATKYPSITVKVMSCESKSVPFTFCNMKSNIVDLKKKRGRKRKMISCNYEENTEGKIHSIFQESYTANVEFQPFLFWAVCHYQLYTHSAVGPFTK